MIDVGQIAENLVSELGITSAEELDIDVIAMAVGVEVRYENLIGCEASLVGFGDRAIATINRRSIRGRERFSLAHELGHWQLHRGRSFQCRLDEPQKNLSSDRALEKEADRFAAHLLMPAPIFIPLVQAYKEPNFQNLASMAQTLETSLMATALRLVDINTLLVIVACYDRNGRRWWIAANDVSRRWLPKRDLDEDSFAYDLLYSGIECKHLGKQPADVWFENTDADKYEVREQCIASHEGAALVLLYLEPRMMEGSFGWNSNRR
ncbi:ImmA/IrrE family metallo-endopeptidase [Comamonas testosteroni]|uniref:ImmA/IrrE family metallo-endopeptidase n=1 Tax=Comamonas testosteroni TaxID=285 RepID=UPI0026F0AB6B|nr:ImmA/IrrE family metallo-endopeptidase [Comamonas testosteroni]